MNKYIKSVYEKIDMKAVYAVLAIGIMIEEPLTIALFLIIALILSIRKDNQQ